MTMNVKWGNICHNWPQDTNKKEVGMQMRNDFVDDTTVVILRKQIIK